MEPQGVSDFNTEFWMSTPVGQAVLRLHDLEDVHTLRLLDANPAASEITGLNLQGEIGSRLSDVAPLLTETDVPSQFVEVIRSGVATSIGNLEYGDDRIRKAIYAINAFPLGEQLLGIVFEDVTERVRAHETMQLVIEAAPSGIIAISAEGSISLVNSQIETLFGYSREELLGHPIEILVPERARNSHAGLRAAFSAGPKARRMGTGRDLYARRKDGTEVPVEIGLNPVEGGKDLAVLTTIVDISERKRIEEALASHARDLSRSNQELDDFTYVVSHDLKEPLRAIDAFGSFLDEDYGDRLDEQGRKYIETMRESAVRMKDLIDGLLQLSRIGRTEQEMTSVQLTSVLEEVTKDLEFLLRERNVDVRIPARLPTVVGHSLQMKQVFENLISNAVKFNDKPRPVIEITSREDDRFYTLSVSDNGIGIDEKYHDKVFAIFQRLNRREEYEGTGAGLAICKRIVEAHGGTIWIDSSAGQGTTISFTIPRAPLQKLEVKDERAWTAA